MRLKNILGNRKTKSTEDHDLTTIEPEEEQNESVNLEKLGRQRPEVFSSTWKEVACVVSMIGALALGVSLKEKKFENIEISNVIDEDLLTHL